MSVTDDELKLRRLDIVAVSLLGRPRRHHHRVLTLPVAYVYSAAADAATSATATSILADRESAFRASERQERALVASMTPAEIAERRRAMRFAGIGG